MPAPKAKTNPKSATAIAAIQDMPKLIHVRETMTPSETVSEKEWIEGQVLTSMDDKVDYFLDRAAEQVADDLPLRVERKDAMNCVNRVTQDTEEGDQLIIDYILQIHEAKRETKSVAVVNDTAIVNLAIKLAPALANDLVEGYKALEKTKFVQAELAFHIQETLTEDEINSVPEVASKRPTKPVKGDNKKYNKLYRSKVTGVDRGTPSYIGDLFDRMPDAAGRRLGKSILAAMDKIAPVGQEPAGRKAKDDMNKLATERKNGTKNLEGAFKLLQRFALLNEFKHVKASFRVNDAGEPDLQNLKPIKVAEINGTTLGKDGKKIIKANQDWDWFQINTILNWDCENLPRDTPYAKVLVNKTRVTEIKAMTETPELWLQVGRIARYLTGGRTAGLKNEITSTIDATDKVTGLHKNQAVLADMLTILNVLGPHKKDIEAAIKADAARAEANEKDDKSQAKETDAKAIAALQAAHGSETKTAA